MRDYYFNQKAETMSQDEIKYNQNKALRRVVINAYANNEFYRQKFDRLGINTSYAVNMFFNQVILNEGFPFDVRIPKPEMSEAEKLAKAIDSTGGNGSVSLRNQKILHLLAEGDLDYETAVFALKRSFA